MVTFNNCMYTCCTIYEEQLVAVFVQKAINLTTKLYQLPYILMLVSILTEYPYLFKMRIHNRNKVSTMMVLLRRWRPLVYLNRHLVKRGFYRTYK